MAARLGDPALEVSPDHVLVLKNAGPVGGPGMAATGDAHDPEDAF